MTRRKARGLRLAAALAAVLPVAAACGIQPSGITALGPAPGALSATPAPTLAAVSDGTQIVLFFYQNERLTPVYRPAANGPDETSVLSALIAGPSKQELAEGFTTAVPAQLSAKIGANGMRAAYSLNLPLGQHAKSQFICTMQYYDVTKSIGIQVLDGSVNWNSCSETTNQYVPMPGEQSGAGIMLAQPSASPGG